MKKKIRRIEKEDIQRVLAIYQPYVENTGISFEYKTPTKEEFEERVNRICDCYPYLVYEIEDRVVGYAYASQHKERAAYQWNAELSIYIEEAYTRQGIGTKLYETLLELLKLQNIKNVYSVITIPNEKSRKLHEKLGFQELGIYPKTGYKNGKWLDVLWMGKNLGEYEKNPKKVIKITEIEKVQIEEILKRSRSGFL